MILVAGGDSFIYGAELADENIGRLQFSRSTFPALLANSNGLDYHCAAWPGSANNAISRMTMSKCQELNNQVLVLISWTFTHRYEFRFTYDTLQRTSPWYSISSWSTEDNVENISKMFNTTDESVIQEHLNHTNTARKTGVSEFAKVFYKHVGNGEYYELYSSLKEIVFMQNYLKLNNIPYMFTAADMTFKDHPNYIRSQDQYLQDLYNQIDWNCWYFFPPGSNSGETLTSRGFYQWAVENKYKVGVTHPLEDAHRDAAELIKEKFNELVKKSI
jgi:hypothetical protein